MPAARVLFFASLPGLHLAYESLPGRIQIIGRGVTVMMKKMLMIYLAAQLIIGLVPVRETAAAAIEFTDAINHQLSETSGRAGGTNGTKLLKQYDTFKAERKETVGWDDKIAALRYANEAKASEVRRRISDLDKDKIRNLEEQLNAAKRKYQPLFDSYTTLNKQIAAAKKLKDKTLSKMLQTQANSMKLLVNIGRQDIKLKQAALTAAKKERSGQAAKVRSVLSGIEPYKSKIKSDKSAISTPNKLLNTEWKNFKAAVKSQDPSRTSDTLARMLTLSGQILAKKKSIFQHEQRIETIIRQANAHIK